MARPEKNRGAGFVDLELGSGPDRVWVYDGAPWHLSMSATRPRWLSVSPAWLKRSGRALSVFATQATEKEKALQKSWVMELLTRFYTIEAELWQLDCQIDMSTAIRDIEG